MFKGLEMALSPQNDAAKKKGSEDIPDIPRRTNRDLLPVLGIKDKEKLKRINFNLTEEEHAALKVACIREKTSISDVMAMLVRGWLKEHAE